MDLKIQLAKSYHECKSKAIKKVTICLHPDCNEKSINSHILQKNGILSSIAEDKHVYELHINKFGENKYVFKKVGINEAFSFNCFCYKHDSELFKEIELKEIDFSHYRSMLLFTLRTIYNEKYRKLVNINMYDCLLKNHTDLYEPEILQYQLNYEKLGLLDIINIENGIWKDINHSSETYVFQYREIARKEVCLSAFYNYDTSKELDDYLIKYKQEKEDVIHIFVNLFPYKGKSILMMGYKKKDEKIVKGYVNEFFTINEKRLERKITNLMMFICETWAVSNKFYKERIQNNEDAFHFAIKFAMQNKNERKFFDLNIFNDNFSQKFAIFKRNANKFLLEFS